MPAQHHRTAQIPRRGDLVACQPQSADDAGIERARRVVAHGFRGKGEAQESAIVVRPLVDTDQMGQDHVPAGFLARFAQGGGGQ